MNDKDTTDFDCFGITNEKSVDIEVTKARHLPRTCTVGPLKSVHFKVICPDGKELRSHATKISHRSDVADTGEGCVTVWKKRFRIAWRDNGTQDLKVLLYGSGSSSAEPVLQLTTLLGSVSIELDKDDSNPFSFVSKDFRSTRRLCTNGVCTTSDLEKWFPVQQGSETGKPEILLKLSLRCLSRDTTFLPSPQLLRACAVSPSERTGHDIRHMTSELLRIPAATQISSPLMALLMAHAELCQWARGDLAEPQPRHPRDSALHFVLAGRLDLFSGETEGGVLSHARTGIPRGWRGPGEALGEGALLVRGGIAAAAVCASATALTLRVGRRACEELLEPLRRADAHFTADVQASPHPHRPWRSRRARTGSPAERARAR
jgi:hypothetical protein